MKTLKEYGPVLISGLIIVGFSIRVEFLNKEVSGWFISMAAVIVSLIIGLLIKQLLKQ